MTDFDDRTLLGRYVKDGSDAAFADIVRRYLKLVYLAALRQTGGRQALAEEITQAVFTDLAHKAHTLVERPVLAGWLYTSTRFAAAKVLRSEARRRAREQEAHTMQEIAAQSPDAGADWERLRPAIDDALHTLEETDREAVLLRFFEGRAFAEIGTVLRLTEEAARKRVDRALDKLQLALVQRGIASTSAALSIALVQLSAAPAPAGLGATVIAAALRPAVSSAVFVMATMAAVLVLAMGSVAWQYHIAHQNERAAAILREQSDALRLRVRSAERESIETQRQANAAQADNARLKTAIDAASLAGVVDQEASRAAFVIDTSGSMRDPRQGGLFTGVIAKLDQILSANPHLRYFQVFDGDGRYVVSDTTGKWLPNDEAARDAAKETLRRYNQDTVSNPVPGVTAALRALDAGRDPLSRMHIFVLGDELNSQDHTDLLLAQIDELNPADAQGRRRVTISAVGFQTWLPHLSASRANANPSLAAGTTSVPLATEVASFQAAPPRTFARFNRLMTELATRHGGTFAIVYELGNEP